MSRNGKSVSIVQRSTGQKFKIGSYRRDRENPNDKKYAAGRYEAENLPPRVDLRHYMTRVENQGQVGSCTANAMAGAYEYLAKRIMGDSGDVSRLFIYYNARDLDGEANLDEGTYLRNCIKILQEIGTCTEDTWPYDPEKVHEQPDDTAYEEASRFLIEEAQRINVDLYAMKHCLAEGYPFAFGLTLFKSFMRKGNKGIPMPNPEREECLGGHAMLCVGYSDSQRVFVVRNSWGEKWGDQGYCYIPYDYMTNPEYCHDCWTIRSVTDLDFSAEVWYDEEEDVYEEEDYEDEGDEEEYDYYYEEDEEEDEDYYEEEDVEDEENVEDDEDRDEEKEDDEEEDEEEDEEDDNDEDEDDVEDEDEDDEDEDDEEDEDADEEE